jgi:hypothetical protein
MSFKLKRDITTTLAPAINQVEVGELVLNVQTGTLYTKKRDENGIETIVKFVSVPLSSSGSDSCTNAVPVITFGDVTNFCCNGSVLVVTINNLLVNNAYTYQVENLLANSSVVFAQSTGNIVPNNSSTRQVPVSININSNQPNALIKFSVYNSLSQLQTEAIVAICCKNCSAT